MKGEKQQRREGRLSGQKDTELLYLEEAACVEGSIHQPIYCLLPWVAGP